MGEIRNTHIILSEKCEGKWEYLSVSGRTTRKWTLKEGQDAKTWTGFIWLVMTQSSGGSCGHDRRFRVLLTERSFSANRPAVGFSRRAVFDGVGVSMQRHDTSLQETGMISHSQHFRRNQHNQRQTLTVTSVHRPHCMTSL